MIAKEEMNICGYTKLGMVDSDTVDFLRSDLLKRKEEEIARYGRPYLEQRGYADLLRNSFRYHPKWVELIEAPWLNNFIDSVLNDTAIIHDCFCLLNTDGGNCGLTRNKFHRDAPWIKDTRVSVAVFLLLADTTNENGPTEVVPGTHLFKEEPSEEYMEAHKVMLTGQAGQVWAMDAALQHKAGINRTGKPRPLLNMRYQLAFLKRPIDLCEAYQSDLENASDLLKARMGWNSRSMRDAEEALERPGKWQSGQYRTDNTNVHE